MAEEKQEKREEIKEPKKTVDRKKFVNRTLKFVNEMQDKAKAESIARRVLRKKGA